jgi:hypothetical protein
MSGVRYLKIEQGNGIDKVQVVENCTEGIRIKVLLRVWPDN